MRNEIRVREAGSEDAEALAEVMIAGMRSAFTGLVPEQLLQWPDSAANWRKTLTNGLDTGEFIDVAMAENGLMVGLVMGCQKHDDATYGGEVLNLNVLPEYQRQGVGGMLVRHAARRLAERGIYSLCVRTLRINPYRSFYERLGGDFVSEQPYDWDGEIFSECLYGWRDTRELVETG